MAEEYIYINYSAEDIERYLRGQMSAKDMHALERAALQDPFLADAIEGYRHAPFAQTYQHLEEISAALLGEKKQAKIVALPVRANYYWWQAAVVAGVIIIIGGGLLWFAGYNKTPSATRQNIASVSPKQKQAVPISSPNQKAINNSNAIAKTKEKQFSVAENETVVNANNQKDSSETVGLEFVPAQPAAPQKPRMLAEKKMDDSIFTISSSTAFQANTGGLAVQSPASNDKFITVAPNSLFYRKNDTSVLIDAKKWFADNITSHSVTAEEPQTFKAKALRNNFVNKPNTHANWLQGFVVDDKQQALGNAIVYSDKGKQMALTDNNGYFRLNVADTQLAVQVSSAGYQTTQIQLKNNIANYIQVHELPPSAFNKVEVIEFGNNKKLAKRLPSDSLFPEGGWQSFREYVYKKLHKEKEMDTTGAEITYLGNTVEIEFVVDENGIARDLKITRSVNEKIDAKAIEVVQQWPKWIATRKNKIGKVIIQF